MDKQRNEFERYKSKVKRVNIPIPGFEYVHKNLLSNRFKKSAPGLMIGRDRIIEKLKNWLSKEISNGGSYLITGFRGMGKTCFVERVLYELVAEPGWVGNTVGLILFLIIGVSLFYLFSYFQDSNSEIWDYAICIIGVIIPTFIFWAIHKFYWLKEKGKKYLYRIESGTKLAFRNRCNNSPKHILQAYLKTWKGLSSKEWSRINNLIYGSNVREKKFSNISININLGQEILDERSILCVLTSSLYTKYKQYVLSPIANSQMWALYTIAIVIASTLLCISIDSSNAIIWEWLIYLSGIPVLIIIFCLIAWHQFNVLLSLRTLRKRIDAEMRSGETFRVKYDKVNFGGSTEYVYPLANVRDIESQLIEILDRIERFPVHPTFYFVFDELDKVETPFKQADETADEFTNEKYLSSGGTSRKRKYVVMHLLANMKYLTTTAKAKFIFIAGREMYDGYLADLTDRESAISSLFDGVIYVESFCKNEKSEKDVMYNAETFIARQLISREFIEQKVMDNFIVCKQKGEEYVNPDINLKMYYEYLTLAYTRAIMQQTMDEWEKHEILQDARSCIDKAIGLLYHFTVYLYHISNGSPKKMRMTFEELVRPIKNKKEFVLSHKRKLHFPLNGNDVDIYITQRCKYLLSFGDKEQRVIGFIHYISFPVNQIITDANQFGDKLLISASFLINHLYKYHSGGFSWRNIEQTPELLEVYKIPEFRGFINSILRYLVQTHIIQVPCGLYQFKFRKQISEEISLASKVSEKISAIFNFTLDESQSVKRHYVEMLNSYQEKVAKGLTVSAHTIAGIHHILGDLYISDEEYNLAIFEYQSALRELDKVKAANEDPHCATFTLAYIRNMLKLGMAFEKRRTYASAYNTYNEVIDRLIRFREFDESSFGLKYVERQTDRWPYSEAILYNGGYCGYYRNLSKIEPEPFCEGNMRELRYKTKGQYMITDFSSQLTPDKHTVIQRLAMLEDTRIVYQALLAKLFINEKIELGGITRSNLDVIEGEYQYIHLTVNEKEKFLISTDFFRRLGDIMYYKNGLIGFNFAWDKPSAENSKIQETFIDSLYYYAFNFKTELQVFCNQNRCYDRLGELYKHCKKMTFRHFKAIQQDKYSNIFNFVEDETERQLFMQFWKNKKISNRIKRLPLETIEQCSADRRDMWKKNRNLPCYACKYYNRSLRIIMQNLFGIDVEGVIDGEKSQSKTITILRQIVRGGSSKSMRQNYMVQLAEVLDCLGNTTLSCSNSKTETVSSEFLSKFLHDAHLINDNLDKEKKEDSFWLLSMPVERMSKIETCILYYWEASICFRFGNDMKKAAGSMKKILRVLQNYLRVAAQNPMENYRTIEAKVCIGEFLNEIKNRIVKQCLLCLFSHYNYINAIEIQRLKWIFYVQMYENISLSRLTLFPDVEEIMLIYYELIRLCIVNAPYSTHAIKGLLETRKSIEAYGRKMPETINYTWDSIEERNKDFNTRLINVYNNISMGGLRHENTVYERILSLQMKTIINRHILDQTFKKLGKLYGVKRKESSEYFAEFVNMLDHDAEYSNDWKRYFPHKRSWGEDDISIKVVSERFRLLEFLIEDSIYCLTEILDTISPHLTTTLFTQSFIGSIYDSLNRWNMLFDALFRFYKFFDEYHPFPLSAKDSSYEYEKMFEMYDTNLKIETAACSRLCSNYSDFIFSDLEADKESKKMDWRSPCPYFNKECRKKGNRFEKEKNIIYELYRFRPIGEDSDKLYRIWNCRSLSDRLFKSLINLIGKPNIQYTFTNYSGEMAIKSYRNAKEMHREGRAYKDMISRMYFIDDDLKNDTVQFDLAVERFKINSDYIDKKIEDIMEVLSESLYDIENFCMDNETRTTLSNRFVDLFPNVAEANE